MEEIDQASVDIIKTILDSKNGKKFMKEYLQDNLSIMLQRGESSDYINCVIVFDGYVICSAQCNIRSSIEIS